MWQQQQIAALIYAMSAPANYTLNQRPPHLASPQAYEENFGVGGDVSDEEDDEQLRTLYIGNLEDRVTEDLLYEVFLQAGPIESVRIPKDNNGRQRGFGFVTYSHRCTPAYALKLFAGLPLFRRTAIIKLQCEPNSSGKRRSLPNESDGRYGMPRSSDNSMLRSTSYPSFYDPGMNDRSNNPSPPTTTNPFRTNSPDFGGRSRDNRSGGRGDRGNNRMHPYQRDDRRQRR